MTIYHYHWSCRNASCLGNSWASCWELVGVGQWFIVCTSAAVILRFTSSWPHLRCAVGLEELLLLCYIVVYYYNGAQLYEQFLQVGLLDRARILLGLALCLLSIWAEPAGIGPWPGWLAFVFRCYDTVGWVIWPVKSSRTWPIMCRVGRYALLYLYVYLSR